MEQTKVGIPAPGIGAHLTETLERFKREGGTNTSDILRACREDDAEQEELLPCGCCLCECPLAERDAVHTGRGMAHEECAEKRWPFDPHRDLGIPRGEL